MRRGNDVGGLTYGVMGWGMVAAEVGPQERWWWWWWWIQTILSNVSEPVLSWDSNKLVEFYYRI